jgi:hypothetical protein
MAIKQNSPVTFSDLFFISDLKKMCRVVLDADIRSQK